MTGVQKVQIISLRQQGKGYTTIATTIGLTKENVSKFCKFIIPDVLNYSVFPFSDGRLADPYSITDFFKSKAKLFPSGVDQIAYFIHIGILLWNIIII